MELPTVIAALVDYGPAGVLLVLAFLGAWERREDRKARLAEVETRAAADIELARALASLQATLPTVCRNQPPGLRGLGHG